MFQPFFSVLVPSYNRPEFLKKCLKSVFDNDFKDFEVVISDDHSKNREEIENVIKPYLSRGNVRFIYQPQNLGLYRHYNFLVSKARGKFLIIVDDDDKLRSDALRKLKEYIEAFPDYDLYGLGYEVIDENDRLYYSCRPPKTFELSLEHPGLVRGLFFSDFLPFWVFHSFAICYKREIGDEIRYQEGVSIGADLVFLFQCIDRNKKMLVIPEILFSYRKHSSNWTGPPLTNIMSRRDILYNILYRGNFNSRIQKLISSDSYRKRYLFDPIIFNKMMDEETLGKLNLKEEHLKELKRFFRPKIYLIHHFRIRFEQLTDYVRLFGLRGLFFIFLSFNQKIYYKIKKKI